jgi:AraC-like DNA-binding protein
MPRASAELLWSRVLAGRLTFFVGDLTIRVLRVRWNRHAPAVDRVDPHRHPFHQILYYTAGQGTQRLGDQARRVRAGSLCFLRAGLLHSFEGAGGPVATCLAFDFEFEGAAARRPAVRDPSAVDGWVLRRALEAGERHVVSLGKRLRAEAAAFIARINREAAAPSPGSLTAKQGMLLEMLALFLQAASASAPLARRPPPARFRNEQVLRRALALADIPEDPDADAPPTLRGAARSVGVSADHLNRLLRQQTGLTFKQLLIQRRLEKAKGLLRGDPELTCTDVALLCGFSDSNYFARLFRRKVGRTPTAFRRQRPADAATAAGPRPAGA